MGRAQDVVSDLQQSRQVALYLSSLCRIPVDGNGGADTAFMNTRVCLWEEKVLKDTSQHIKNTPSNNSTAHLEEG